MNEIKEKLIVEAVYEAIGGIVNQHRTAARRAQQSSVRTKIPLVEIHESVRSRIDGLRGGIAADDVVETDGPLSDIDAAIRTLVTPTVAELRQKWLPKVLVGWKNVVVTHDALELDVVVPPPRKMYAR